MIVYQIDPIDTWGGWKLLKDVLAEIDLSTEQRDEVKAWTDHYAYNSGALLDALKQAHHLATLLDIEANDVREGPYLAPLPENNCCPTAFLLAWKQDNNGTTYIASPYPLPWLGRNCLNHIDSPGKVRPRAQENGRAWEALKRHL